MVPSRGCCGGLGLLGDPPFTFAFRVEAVWREQPECQSHFPTMGKLLLGKELPAWWWMRRYATGVDNGEAGRMGGEGVTGGRRCTCTLDSLARPGVHLRSASLLWGEDGSGGQPGCTAGDRFIFKM